MAQTRLKSDTQLPPRQLPAAALRAVLREGYRLADLKRDALAGAVVGVVALPLSMALSVAVGAAPQHGLYTAIVAGSIVALLGGSRTQVTGPTAAFVVVLAPIHARFGLSGLLVSGALAGALLVLMGLLRLGKLIQYIPHPVTSGFTAGIATVIAVLQLKDLLGLRLEGNPEHLPERVVAMLRALPSASAAELLVGALTLGLLLVIPRLTERVPPALVALPLAALAALALARLAPGLAVDTIASRFQTLVAGELVAGIPRLPPLPGWPWRAGDAPIGLGELRALLPGAFAIAMLGAIESLLSAVVADGMARTRHDPDAELVAQGIGNIVAPCFGGIPATGAIARTAVNIRSGARSPVAAAIHAVVVLAAMLALAPLIGFLPMASLAALLLVVAWGMADAKHFARILRVAPTSDVVVLVTCYLLTVVTDMVIAVTVGVVLAAFLFMRRMVEVAGARSIEGEHPELPRPVPAGVLVYDITGPLFFGAAEKATAALGDVGPRIRAVVLRLDNVPMVDATGVVALESALESLGRRGTLAVLCGLRPQPLRVLRDAGVVETQGRVLVRHSVEGALDAAEAHLRSLA